MNKIALIAIGALILVGAVVFVLPSPVTSPMSGDEVPSSTTSVSGEATSSLVGTAPKPTTTIKPSPSKPNGGTNRVIAPAGGEQWVIRESHSIQWSEESLGNGSIYLIDAGTKAVVGLVTPSLTLHQKTFTWNTRDVFLYKSGSQKKDVQPGQYILRITFDVGNKPTIESGIFSLIYADQKATNSHSLIIKNYAANPTSLKVKKGETIYISNNDTISHKLSMSIFSPITITPSQTVLFGTSGLSVGFYEFYSEQYSGLKIGITVQ